MGPTIVSNIRDVGQKSGAIYIGRGEGERGIYGNPFTCGQNDPFGRVACIRKFMDYFWRRMKEDVQFNLKVQQLKGKELLCWCAPLPCHGEVYAVYLDNDCNILKTQNIIETRLNSWLHIQGFQGDL